MPQQSNVNIISHFFFFADDKLIFSCLTTSLEPMWIGVKTGFLFKQTNMKCTLSNQEREHTSYRPDFTVKRILTPFMKYRAV